MAKSTSTTTAPDASMRVILLHGKDSMRIRDWTNKLVAELERVHGEIQRFDFDGATTEAAVLLDELRSYGLLQQHKLVVLDKADQFLLDDDDEASSAPAPKGRGRRKSTRELMESYVAAPVEDATLLMKADTWRKSKLDGLISKVGMVGKFEPPSDAEAVKWITGEGAGRHEVKVKGNAAELLVELLGPSLDRLDMELGKLASYVGPGKTIKREMVGEMVGLSREEQAWILQESIATGDSARALGKLRELLEISRHSEIPLMWSEIDLVRKIHAASKLLKEGVDEWAAAKEIGVWGSGKNMIFKAARALESAEIAQLLRRAVLTDQDNKSGAPNTRRSLEVLTMEIADTIGSA